MEDVEDEPQTEDVADWLILGLHVLKVDDLWRHVAWSSASHEEVLLGVCKFCKPVVSDHAVVGALRPEEDVLRLEVAVHDVLRVHLLQSFQQVLDDLPHLIGLELFFTLNKKRNTLILS